MAAIVLPDEDEHYLLALIDDPSGLDLAEFCWVDEEAEDGCWRAWDFQWAWYTNPEPLQIDQCGRALGKALDVDTPIPTPDGWTTMGAIRPGDVLYGSDGSLVTVAGVSPVMWDRNCYEVVFDDGSSIVADAEHLWSTWDKRARRSGRDRRIPRGPEVRTTEEIAATLMVGGEWNHSIPLTAPLEGGGHVPFDPWVLGYWLGDGSTASAVLTVGDDDVDYVRAQVEGRGFVLNTIPSAPLGYRLAYPHDVNHKTGTPTAHLRALGLIASKKVIPEQYLRASREVRQELLAGLVDSDGHVTSSGRVEITLANVDLVLGVQELAASLGRKVFIAERRMRIAGRDVGPCWRLGWHGHTGDAQMPRKVARIRPSKYRTKVTHRRVVAVRPVVTRPVRCIRVDADDSLFLAGRAMVPTHNTNGIEMRAFAFPLNYPGQEMLITAPELNHLRPIVDKVEQRILSKRFMREFLPNVKGKGINRQPHWQARFANGSRILSRLPNKDGKGVKGIHSAVIELDEGQDYPLAGWVEIIESRNRWSKDSFWRIHGVSRGVRDKYYELTQPNSGFLVHRYMAMHRPSWTPEEREEKVRTYGGSRQNPDYKRNIYGDHGDATNPVFVLARLMACVDQDEGSEYNTEVYQKVSITYEQVLSRGPGSILGFLDMPGTHRAGHALAPKGYSAYYGGMDVGATNHPSEILMFGQRAGLAKEHYDLLLRVHMQRIPVTTTETPDKSGLDTQEAVIYALFAFYGQKLRAFGIDRTGLGFSLVQNLTRGALSKHIHGYNFSEKVIVGFEDRELERGETQEDLAIMRNVVEHATDVLRNEYVDPKRVTLPFDRELLGEWQGQTYTIQKSAGNPYGKRQYAEGSFHTLDAGKMMAAAKTLPLLDEMAHAKPKQAPVLDVFVGA